MNTSTPRTGEGPTPTAGVQLNPGDDAAPGTPGTGEDICQACKGSGRNVKGGDCPYCGGTGKVVEGIGGG
ncbi:MAG TPA: hypothetical protein VEC06_17995 [Paucimonas sp.]|nr:hypothetical protein [Paucimonas sp.]